jgi:hypothetical protein
VKRAIYAQPESDRGHHGQRENGRPPEAPPRIADVLAKRFQELDSALIAALFADCAFASELKPRLPAGLRFRHARSHVLANLHFDVESEFVAQFLFDPAWQKRRPQAEPKIVPRHFMRTPIYGRSPP